MKKRSSKQSLAAKKGWKTRRANQQKRSLAAKKGWKTRRKRDKAKAKKPELDGKKAIAAILKELHLLPGGPFQGEKGEYTVEGDFKQPPELLVRITIEGSGGTKHIRKRVRYDYDSEIFDPDPEYPWETEGNT